MKGSYRIDLYTKRIRYRMQIERNITILTGNSGSGKTELIRLISAYVENPASSGVSISCQKPLRVLTSDDWQNRLTNISGSIVFIDEGKEFIYTNDFARAVKGADNYFVIVTRDSIPSLPYSISSIVGFREKQNIFNEAKQVYNEQYQIYYGFSIPDTEIRPAVVVTEDSNSGYDFFSEICLSNGIDCQSANGKSNIKRLIDNAEDNTIYVYIVDGAAFGSEIAGVVNSLRKKPECFLYAPESFEWLILESGVLDERLSSQMDYNEVRKMLEHTSEYADSCDYISWEHFYTELLQDITHGDKEIEYHKGRIAAFYLQEGVSRKIVLKIEKIQFEK